MRKLTINLPKYRLDLKISKRRGNSVLDKLTPLLYEVKRVKKGSKVSRFFRYVFENKRVQKILGANFALMILATSFVPSNTLGAVEPETSIMAEEVVSLKTEKNIQYPVEEIEITQGFKVFHPGIDLDGLIGDPIKPIKAGKVLAISRSRYAYGNAILLDHGENLTSLYAHLSKILVSVGDEVTTNTVIGEMGVSGRAYGDHLHLEIRDHGVPINPFSILPYPNI